MAITKTIENEKHTVNKTQENLSLQNIVPDNLNYTKLLKNSNVDFKENCPWYFCDFIAEIPLGSKNTRRAFQMFEPDFKVAIINYFDAKNRGYFNKNKDVREELGYPDALILSGIGNDHDLEKVTAEEYHEAALKIKADAVTTIDDYVYSNDNDFPNFQLRNLTRIRSRTKTLIDLSENKYSILGLVVGKNIDQIQNIMKFFASCQISDFVFPCGDYLKNNCNPNLKLIETFLNMTKDLEGWNLLLGVDSPKILSKLKFNCFASTQWSFDAHHNRIYKNKKIVKSNSIPKNSDISIQNIRVANALHNLNECQALKQNLVENYGCLA